MADLLVHFASAFAVGRALRDARLRAIVYVGVCLPDLLYKGQLYGLGASNWVCEPSHSPLALVVFSYAGAMLFEEAWRRRAFGALLGGSWLHVGFDLAKDYQGSGVIPWAFPFSLGRAELGWYRNEDSVILMVPALALIVLLEGISAFRRRRPTCRGPAGT